MWVQVWGGFRRGVFRWGRGAKGQMLGGFRGAKGQTLGGGGGELNGIIFAI